MVAFCDTPVWNWTELLDGEWPRFTPCFQQTVLMWVPCGWLVIVSIFYIYALVAYYSNSIYPIVNSKQFVLKMILYSVFFAVTVAELMLQIADCKKNKIALTADILAPAVLAVTLSTYSAAVFLSHYQILACVLTILEQTRGFITSGVLFLFWTMLLVAQTVPFYTIIEHQEFDSNLLKFILFYIRYALNFFIVLVHCFAEKPRETVKTTLTPCPETEASFLSRLTFWWANWLLLKGYEAPLTEEMMHDLNPQEKSCNAVPKFLKSWTEELNRARTKIRGQQLKQESLPSTNRSNNASEKTDSGDTSSLITVPKWGTHRRNSVVKLPTATILDQEDVDAFGALSEVMHRGTSLKAMKGQLPPASLMKVLFKTFWWELLRSQIWKLFYDSLLLTNPLVLGQLVSYVQSHKPQAWKGYVLSATLFIFIQLQSFFFHQLFHLSTCLGLRLRSCLISTIFRKSLSMNNEARRASTVGQVVNLMSVDVENIQNMISMLWAVWSAPLQVSVALYLLYSTLGVAMLAGLGVMLVIFPINGIIMTKLGSLMKNVMAQKDLRMKLISEVLNGMKILKLYAWEQSFSRQISDIRERELHVLWRYSMWGASMMVCWTLAPYAVSLFTFVAYIYTSEEHLLRPQMAFVAISLFSILRLAISVAPMAITDVIQAAVSLQRINQFLCYDDLESDSIKRDKKSEYAISIKNGSFGWGAATVAAVKKMNFHIPGGSLVAVVGKVGSGKSSFISALIGDMKKISGEVCIKGSVAYVPQQAWIQNHTLRNNILFGKELSEEFYNQCLSACALRPDLEVLAAGDLTEIGEKGINLSGGQKQRVSLARAVYSEADVYFLDDPLSAVDSQVGKHIFEEVIGKKGLLKDKTRVLVTHGVQWLPHVDKVIVMRRGAVSAIGTYEQLISQKGPFALFLKAHLQQVGKAIVEKDSEVWAIQERISAITLEDESTSVSDSTTHDEDTTESLVKEEEEESMDSLSGDILIEEEEVQTGSVEFEVYKEYMRSLGYIYTFLIVILYIMYQAASVTANIWLSKWTDDRDLANLTLLPANSSQRAEKNSYYLILYGSIGASQMVFMMSYSIIQSLRTVHASRTLHQKLLTSIFHAPMAFFDTTPMGRIVNRFSQDITTIDSELPMTLFMGLGSASVVFSTLIVISYSTPIFLVAIVPLALVYITVQQFYIPTSRQLKRLESKTRSPIYNFFSETLAGASVIRAYDKVASFVQESEQRVDVNQIFHFYKFISNRWLGFRLEFLGNIVVLLASGVAVVLRDQVSAGIVGLSVSYALEITSNLNWLVRMISNLETQVVSVERVKEYSEVKSESPWKIPSHSPPPSWPQNGQITLKDLSLRYRSDTDLVLRKVSLTIKPGEKIGVVGRTGAGKSSLMLALFRLVELDSGKILLDSVDISTLGLHDLRSKLTILPQDPVVFAGTLHMNVDPFHHYDDKQVWQALENAHLKTYVASLPQGLQYECGEGGENLSVGQRQLLCLARALLLKTRVLILDEATAAVDMATDDLIQKTIREKFKDCTVLTIAHRLNTIMDYDKILVLDQGEVAEFDTVSALLAKEGSIFREMAKTAGLVS